MSVADRHGSLEKAAPSANGKPIRDVDRLPENIRYLCSFYPSISHVCRETRINRQQFNKYIIGSVQPSIHLLRRIADFFNLNVDEMFLPTDELRIIFEIKRSSNFDFKIQGYENGPNLKVLTDILLRMSHSDAMTLRRYVGCYFRYNYAFDGSGRVVRSIFFISESNGLFVTKLLERLQHRSNGTNEITTHKYVGVLVALSGCIFNVEYETIMKSCVGHAAFSNLQRPGQKYIVGIQNSYSSATGKPTASRVVLERHSKRPCLREIINQCGMFLPRSPEIPPHILPLIDNSNKRGTDVFSLSNL
ncbi:MAG: helix-turn-helix transcriptional regulator [Geminicoccaceae bacterium]|nr:helix-turn-helix transcriptional regulator [Geminicoccaceae bacterium]